MVACVRGARDMPAGYFVGDDVLLPASCPGNEEWTKHEQAVPLSYCLEVMQLAHDSSLGGHLGMKKTLERIS